MKSQTTAPASSIILFISTIIVSFYWVLGNLIDISAYPVAGAITELLWLPMLLGLFGLPVIALIYWSKVKFPVRSLYFLSLLISGISILILFIFFP